MTSETPDADSDQRFGDSQLPRELRQLEASLHESRPAPPTIDWSVITHGPPATPASSSMAQVPDRNAWKLVAAWIGGMVAGCLLTTYARPATSESHPNDKVVRSEGPVGDHQREVNSQAGSPATTPNEKAGSPTTTPNEKAVATDDSTGRWSMRREHILAAKLADPLQHAQLRWRNGEHGDLPTNFGAPWDQDESLESRWTMVETDDVRAPKLSTDALLREILGSDT